MKTITIEELEALKDAEKTIVDIRPQDQYMRGTFPGAVSLPASRLEEQYEEETAKQLAKFISVLEPTLVIILSIFIGLILISFLLPLIGIMSSIG